jgi:hypothetical protein
MSGAQVHTLARTALGGSMARPLSAGSISAGQTERLHVTIGKSKPIQYFRFSVNATEVVQAALTGQDKRTILSLRNSNGGVISMSTGHGSSANISATLGPGAYFAVVSHTGRGNPKCTLALAATAPVQPVGSTSNGGTSTGSTSTGSTSTGSTSSGGSSNQGSSGVTLTQFAIALDSAIKKGLTQFAQDATFVEAFAPTAYSSVVSTALAQVDGDVLAGSYFQAFADLRTLGQSMLLEAQYTVYWGLPDTSALLGYSQVVTDLEVVGALKEIAYAFLYYVASSLPTHSTSTPAYWTTGVLGSGSSSGVLSSSSQPLLTDYSSGDLSRMNHYFNAMEGNLAANDLWYQEAQQFDPYESISDDNLSESYSPDLDPELTLIENGE